MYYYRHIAYYYCYWYYILLLLLLLLYTATTATATIYCYYCYCYYILLLLLLYTAATATDTIYCYYCYWYYVTTIATDTIYYSSCYCYYATTTAKTTTTITTSTTIITITITATTAAATSTIIIIGSINDACTHLVVQSAVSLITEPPVLRQSRCTNNALLEPMSPGTATTSSWTRRRWTAWPVLARPLLTTTTAAWRRPAAWTRRLWPQRSPTSTTIAVRREKSEASVFVSFTPRPCFLVSSVLTTRHNSSRRVVWDTYNTSQLFQTCGVISPIMITRHNSSRRVVW